MAIRFGLVKEVIVMAFDTVRTNKMRSGLTVLGVVIGITSIVGMTSLIRGFDESIRDLMRADRPGHDLRLPLLVHELQQRRWKCKELLKRPNLTVSDMRALEEQATHDRVRRHRARRRRRRSQRVFYRDQKTKPIIIFGTTENFAEGTRIPILAGRYFNGTEVQFHARTSSCSATPRTRSCSRTPGSIPIGKTGARRQRALHGRRRVRQAAVAGGFGGGADDFVVIPYTTYEGIYGLKPVRALRTGTTMPIQIARGAARRRHAGTRRWPTSSA